VASITYQSFFRLYKRLSGMSGTAITEAKEFMDIYGLPVTCIPTALPVARRDNADAVFRTQNGKWKAVMGDIARRHTKGQPILVGTTSVLASQELSKLLTELKVPHEVLNAESERAGRESEIVAQAGRAFAITIATNMAGRGTDILLGGNPSFFAKKRIMQKLCPVLLTKQTGLPPKEQLAIIENPACIPLPELSEAAVASIDKAVELAGEALGKLPSMIEVENMMATVSESGALTEPHMVALREAYNLCKDEYKVRTEKDKGEVNELGGLHIIGTERHESRRIDQQLRGRAGRQGDPGSSRFFLALDDKLFQVFGGSSIDGLLKTLRVEEDMPLEAQSVSDSLNRVQKNVEEYFYGIRKEMFKYDEILSTQREALYALRRRMVARPADADEEDDSIQATMLEYCIKTADEIVPNYVKDNGVDAEGLAKKLQQFFAGIDLSSDAIAAVPKGELAQMVRDKVEDALDSKEAQLDAAKEGFAVEIERYIALTQVDNLWKQHLKDMDFLKEFVGLRSYKQSDPFEDYQVEGYEIFQEMLDGVRRNTVYSLFQYELKDEANKAKAKDAKGKKKKKKSKK
jgi:preprotein translocase subunit SecA